MEGYFEFGDPLTDPVQREVGMQEFLLEEQSAEAVILPKILPDNVSFHFHVFEGFSETVISIERVPPLDT